MALLSRERHRPEAPPSPVAICRAMPACDANFAADSVDGGRSLPRRCHWSDWLYRLRPFHHAAQHHSHSPPRRRRAPHRAYRRLVGIAPCRRIGDAVCVGGCGGSRGIALPDGGHEHRAPSGGGQALGIVAHGFSWDLALVLAASVGVLVGIHFVLRPWLRDLY